MLVATLLAPSMGCNDSTNDASRVLANDEDASPPDPDIERFLRCDGLFSFPMLTEGFIESKRILSKGLVCVFQGCGLTEIVFPTRNQQCGFSTVPIGGYDGDTYIFQADHRLSGQSHSEDFGSHCEGVVPLCRHLDACELDRNFAETGKLCLDKTDAGGNGDDAGSDDDAGR